MKNSDLSFTMEANLTTSFTTALLSSCVAASTTTSTAATAGPDFSTAVLVFSKAVLLSALVANWFAASAAVFASRINDAASFAASSADMLFFGSFALAASSFTFFATLPSPAAASFSLSTALAIAFLVIESNSFRISGLVASLLSRSLSKSAAVLFCIFSSTSALTISSSSFCLMPVSVSTLRISVRASTETFPSSSAA